uniref:Uncharacterized protein n=1 Tax=Nelumbo nucifera TaxID=4432 RepID=A0A822ZF47_NELNU|nr:TPA_asm: hypothetical protein HUJ06_000254 [Nelumbo nucifera]
MPSAKRFIVLYSFLNRHLSKKVMVFFSSCKSVKFHSEGSEGHGLLFLISEELQILSYLKV